MMNIWIKVLLFFGINLGLAYCSAETYRLGGCSPNDPDVAKYPNWLKKGITRDIGCTFCALLQLLSADLLFSIHVSLWQYAIYTGFSWWGCKSYWTDFCEKYTGTRDKTALNWFLVGLTSWSRWLIIQPWLFPLVFVNAWAMMDRRIKYGDVTKEERAAGAIFII